MVKLFSKNSNLCDHNSPTLQTDRRTDRQTTCDRNTALCTKVHHAVKIVKFLLNLYAHPPFRVMLSDSRIWFSCENTGMVQLPDGERISVIHFDKLVTDRQMDRYLWNSIVSIMHTPFFFLFFLL